LRVSELINLRWEQLDLDQGSFHVRRLTHGVPGTHPFTAAEMRALRRLKSHALAEAASVFLSEWKMMVQADECAARGLPVHPHLLIL
jgi:integrase